MVWHWPQIVVAALYAILLFINVAQDGKPQPETKYSAGVAAIRVALWAALLYFGGFWTGGQ